MHIIVCAKQVPNPEISFGVFQLDENANKIKASTGASWVMNPFDEQAVEAAVRIRDSNSDPDEVKITVLTVETESPRKMIKQALALGADEGLILADRAFVDSDFFATAHLLATAINKLENVDLVIAGRQASDTDAGIVGLGIAELLDIPVITLAKSVSVDKDEVIVERAVGEGEETVGAALPALVTIAHEFGDVRSPSLRETMQAGKKPVETWDAKTLGIDGSHTGSNGSLQEVVRLYRPIRDTVCEWLDGENPAAIAKSLAARLIEQKLI